MKPVVLTILLLGLLFPLAADSSVNSQLNALGIRYEYNASLELFIAAYKNVSVLISNKPQTVFNVPMRAVYIDEYIPGKTSLLTLLMKNQQNELGKFYLDRTSGLISYRVMIPADAPKEVLKGAVAAVGEVASAYKTTVWPESSTYIAADPFVEETLNGIRVPFSYDSHLGDFDILFDGVSIILKNQTFQQFGQEYRRMLTVFVPPFKPDTAYLALLLRRNHNSEYGSYTIDPDNIIIYEVVVPARADKSVYLAAIRACAKAKIQ